MPPLTLDGTTGVSAVQAGVVEQEDLFAGFANGIASADFWYNVADKTVTGPITTLERRNGSVNGMSFDDNSGTFTFPETGLWLIWIFAFLTAESNDFAEINLGLSTDGGNSFSDYTFAANTGSSGDFVSTVSSTVLINVTSTSSLKVNLGAGSLSGNSVVQGSSDRVRTGIGFIRLGDSA